MDNYKYSPLFNYINYIKDFDDEFKYEMCVFFDHFGRDTGAECIYALSMIKKEGKNISDVEYLESFKKKLIEKINEFNNYGYFHFPKIDIDKSIFFKKINDCIDFFYKDYNKPQKKLHLTVYKGGK